MNSGVPAKGTPTANDTGAGVASAALPSVPANDIDERKTRQASLVMELIWVADEVTNDFASEPPASGSEGSDIIKQYRGMLDNIRKLPRQMRSRARREANDWLRAEFKASRERKATERRANRAHRPRKINWRGVWRERRPGPGP
jgi:hypothetical protein